MTPPRDLEAARAEIIQFCIGSFAESMGIRWGIAFKGHPYLVGTAGYHHWMREGGHRVQVGYDLLREHRHHGIMTEALKAISGYGFRTMELNRVEALVDPRNTASVRLLEGLGFHLDGILRENRCFHGRLIDDAIYSLLVREWRAKSDANR